MVRYVLILMSAILVAGCRYMPKLDEVLPDKRSEYKKSQTLPDLEVPPDLSTESINDKMAVPDEEGASFSTYQERVAARKKAREEEGLAENAIEALSGEKVLVVPGSTSEVWDKLHAFWSENGFELDLDDAEYGVQETTWREDQDNLARDKYKIFAETGEDSGSTTLYVSHEGEEMRPDGEGLTWRRRTDTGARDRIVAALQEYLGAAAGTSGARAGGDTTSSGDYVAGGEDASAPVAEIVNSGDGKFYLSYPAEFAEAWSRTGEALAGAGLKVTSSDKGKGTYTVHFEGAPTEKKGVLSKLAFWKGGQKEYQLSLTGVGRKTEIVVLDEDGDWDKSEAAGALLSQLKSELNKATQ
ncbi:MAG: outer membrane protein assembly factor BamC [Gammaproteobacteria bacterium]